MPSRYGSEQNLAFTDEGMLMSQWWSNLNPWAKEFIGLVLTLVAVGLIADPEVVPWIAAGWILGLGLRWFLHRRNPERWSFPG